MIGLFQVQRLLFVVTGNVVELSDPLGCVPSSKLNDYMMTKLLPCLNSFGLDYLIIQA
jgi:hypothetical protein